MSSPTKSTQLIKPPLNATNSWVIRHARDLIGYDGYGAVEQWLDDVNDVDNDSNNESNFINKHENNHENSHENKLSKSPHHGHCSSRLGHAAGELKEYDPDCPLFSQKTIVEVINVAAVETEAEYNGSNDADHWDTTSESSLASYCYGYLPSDSLEGEPLLADGQNTRDADPQSSTDGKNHPKPGDGMACPVLFTSPGAPPSPFPSTLDVAPAPARENAHEVDDEATLERTLARAHLSADKPPSPPSSPFLAVPPPAYTAPARARRDPSSHAGQYPHPPPPPSPSSLDTHGHNYFFAQPYPHLEIDRGASPMPRFRGDSPYPVSPESELPPTASETHDLGVPKNRGITRPVLRRRVMGPRSRWNLPPSFVNGRRRVAGQVPLLTVDEVEAGDGKGED
ncbi:hypothetical protein F4803DRAFT_551864 [Xylaria telfairii]|nr:hypothetical protein F4803DRAFT_551864 [Xylaria telfairii]